MVVQEGLKQRVHSIRQVSDPFPTLSGLPHLLSLGRRCCCHRLPHDGAGINRSGFGRLCSGR